MNFRKKLKHRMAKHIRKIESRKIIERRWGIVSRLFYNQINHTSLGQPMDDIHWGNNLCKEIYPKMIDSSNHGKIQKMENKNVV